MAQRLLAFMSYANRLTALGVNNATTTYGYDAFGARVLQTGTSTTNIYPFKWYSIASSTGSGAKYSTTTEYVFNGDALVATADKQIGATSACTDTGFKTAGTVEVSTGWADFTTTRLGTSDDSRASCDSACDDSDDGQLSDFAFGIPSGSTINGIEMTVEANESVNSGNIPITASLSWNDGSSFTSTKPATVDGTSDIVYTIGGSSDTWGRTWTTSELADGAFRARLDKSPTSDALNVDQIRIKVYYTPPATSASEQIRYVHPDHLGSTNVVTNASGTPVQVLDYF